MIGDQLIARIWSNMDAISISQLFSKIVVYLEDMTDKKAVPETDFGKGRKFEDLATELGI